MLRRHLRTVLDLLKPNTETKVHDQNGLQKSNHDVHSHVRKFHVGQRIMVRSYQDDNPSWISGKIVEQKSDVTFMVELEDGIIWKRHVDLKMTAPKQSVPGYILVLLPHLKINLI